VGSLCCVFCLIGGRYIKLPVNGRSCFCKERASAKKRLFPKETPWRAAQLLLMPRRAAQILRARPATDLHCQRRAPG